MEEEEEQVYMERADDIQEAQAERTCDRNNCCFTVASFFIILTLIAGILCAYTGMQDGDLVRLVAGGIVSIILSVGSLCWAIYYAKKGRDPRAVRPAGFAGVQPRRGDNRFRMRVGRRRGDDTDIESAQLSEDHPVGPAVPGPSGSQPPAIRQASSDRPSGEAAPESTHGEREGINVASPDEASSNLRISEVAASVGEIVSEELSSRRRRAGSQGEANF